MPKFRLPRRPATTVAVISFAVLMLWIAGVVPDRAASAGLDDPDHRPEPSERYDVVNPDYRGTFGGDSKALIAIRTKKGRRIKGLFQAKRKELGCEDGSRQVLTLGAIIIHFRGGRYFDGQSYLLSRSGFASFRAIRGRISKDGRTARGKLLVISNSPYPEDDPGCNTYGWVGWHADRVGR